MRLELHLVFRADDSSWYIEKDGGALSRYNAKADAIAAGQICGRKLESMGGEERLVVHPSGWIGVQLRTHVGA